nr:hypothetical protein [uncultured Methanoregula sp.]
MTPCPFCGSELVYSLLHTLRCMRCKNIWKEGEEDSSPATELPGALLKSSKRSDPLETRLERKLEGYLKRSKGKFCLATQTWQAGDISEELFRKYLRQCVKDKRLAEEKDRYGRVWYSRPG